MTIAIVRQVSRRIDACELTCIARVPIDLGRAREQLHRYTQSLKDLGCRTIELPEAPDLPDSVFVEDTAVVLPEAAVITRPGAPSRRPETEGIAEVLSAHLPLLRLNAPAVLDGGDVLLLGREIFVGLSSRSNRPAIEQLRERVAGLGYQVTAVALRDCLHLKSAVTRIDEETLLINPAWVDPLPFEGFSRVEVDAAEPHGANCLPLHGTVLYASAFPRTLERLLTRGYSVLPLELDELMKAEGAVTCCSLILPVAA
jgi:dimethylargininase